MKRVFPMLLALLMLLCACTQAPAETTGNLPTTIAPVTVPTEPDPPVRPNFGLYEPGSTVEVQTGGAVKYFPLSGTDYYAVEPMNDSLLLFSGTDTTTLTLLREEMDPVKVMLNCYIYPAGGTVRLFEDGLCYFDDVSSEIVEMTASLQEINRTPIPEDAVASPVLSCDGKLAYYFSQDALRCFERNTGISRLLRDSTFPTQETWRLHFDDTVLECFVMDGENSETLYISTQTGELLAAYEMHPNLVTSSDQYFADVLEADCIRHLVGTRGEKPLCLELSQEYISVKPVPTLNGCIAHTADDAGISLHWYDLTKGTLSAQIRLDGVQMPWYLTADAVSGMIWLMVGDQSCTQQALYCWKPALSPTGDETSYLTPFYTALEPDASGLAEIAKQTKVLGEKYGVRIRVWEDAQHVMPEEYTFELEYMVSIYEKCLPVLEKVLSAYPDGFLKKLSKASANGVLTISLVRDIYGDIEQGVLSTVAGVHFWNDGSGYLAVVADDSLEQNLYHELFHAIDSYVMAKSGAYDNWPDLNPDGFIYDYSYVNNQFREDDQYLEDENRAFINMYSMSYPKEDRACIMEYAMMEGNESYFQSDIMQTKLKTLCKGIRDAFKLKKYTQPLIWEQYLK